MKTLNIDRMLLNVGRGLLAATAIVLLMILLACSGCATLQPGADPVVVRMEQSLTVAQAACDTFLKLDNADRALVKQQLPSVHAYAEWLRVQVPLTAGSPVIVARWAALVESADQVKNAYEQNRTPENRMNLVTALATLDTLLAQVQMGIAAVKTINP